MAFFGLWGKPRQSGDKKMIDPVLPATQSEPVAEPKKGRVPLTPPPTVATVSMVSQVATTTAEAVSGSIPEKLHVEAAPSVPQVVLLPEPEVVTESRKVRPGYVNIHGIELPMSTNTSGAPKAEAFTDYIEHNFSIDYQRKCATAWLLGEPFLYEGGSSIGKSKGIMRVAQQAGYEVYPVTFSQDTDKYEIFGTTTVNPGFGNNGDQRKFIVALSQLAEALTPEEGKIKVCSLNEYNGPLPGVSKRINEIIDAYKGVQSQIVIPELGGRVIKFDRNKVKLAASMNEPGGRYPGTNVLAPDNLRRWLYQKGPESLPVQDFMTAGLGKVGIKKGKLIADTPILNRVEPLTRQEMSEIQGMEEIFIAYMGFHVAMNNLIKIRQIGNKAPQKFFYDDNDDPNRIIAYISHFYDGDLTKTIQDALKFIYLGKIIDPVELKKAEELLAKVTYSPPKSKTRTGLDTITPGVPKVVTAESEGTIDPTPKNIRKILKILGDKRFNGPNDYSKNFGIPLSAFVTPTIPYSWSQLAAIPEDKALILTSLADDLADDASDLHWKIADKTGIVR